MGKTLKELMKENKMLKSRNMSRRKSLSKDMDKRKLIQENRRLKYPMTSNAIAQIKTIVGGSAKSIGSGVKKAGVKQYKIGAKKRTKTPKIKYKLVGKK
jgi:hypothetical protein